MTGTAASVQQIHACSGISPVEESLLQKLYYYSLFAEAAYSETPVTVLDWNCQMDADPKGPPTGWENACSEERPCSQFVVPAMLEDDKWGWHEIAADLRSETWRVDVYEPEGGGPAHVVCDRQPPSEFHVFLAWADQTPNVDDEGFLTRILVPVIHIYQSLADVVSRDEELEFRRFKKVKRLSDPHAPYGDDEIIAIQGTTDWLELRQPRASVNDLRDDPDDPLDGSCVFEFMARVVEHQGDLGDGRFAVTGHSLGGSVAQYVAQQNSGTKGASRFESYAFSAIGLDEDRGADPINLDSFYIDGDALAEFAKYIQRMPGGRAIKFTPPRYNRAGPTDEQRWWSNAGPFTKHKLSTAQRGICNCMDRMGSLTITNP